MTQKLVILICFISNSFLLFSENWEPFPLNQTTYYEITKVKTPWLMNYEDEDLQNAITIIKFDSLFKEKNNQTKYFSQLFNKIDTCLYFKRDSLRDEYDRFPNLLPDSYIIKEDTLIFMINNMDSISSNCLKIPLNLNFNDTFIQSNYENYYTMNTNLKLVSKGEKNIFGILDSVMTFQIQKTRLPEKQDGDFVIELSKKFGFLKFMPLDLLFPWSLTADIQQVELVSALKNSENFGETYNFQYRKRNYLEKPGDIKIFKHLWGELFRFEYAFIRDSVIGVDNSGDVVFIVFNRKIISTNQWEYPDLDKIESYSYLKKDSIIYSEYNAMVDALNKGETFIPSTKLLDKVPNNETQQKNDSLEIIATPLLFKFVEKCGEKDLQIYYNYQATLNRENCNLQNRYFNYRILDKITNLWWEHFISDPHSEGDHVVGYKNGNCEWGDLSWPPKGVSVKDIETKALEIYPNPASDYINIDLSFLRLQGSAIQIYDVFGTEIQTTPALRATPPKEGNQFRIDISTFPPGVYFIRIVNAKPLKFIKL